MASTSRVTLEDTPSEHNPSERDPLLPQRRKKPFYRARPLWLVPIALTATLNRGMGLAPRTEVFVQLACESLWNSRHHTSSSQFHPVLAYHNVTSSYLDKSTLPLLLHESSDIFHFPPVNVLPIENNSKEKPINCETDNEVQSIAARMSSFMATTVGILSALTTGWWGQFGDRHGRTKVLGAGIAGMLFTEFMFLLASKPPAFLKGHAYQLLLVAPIVEGLLGGICSFNGAFYAYLSDCTSHGSRSRIFSRFTGSLMIGIAVGPEISALILHNTHSTTAVFYVSVILATINLFLVLFVFPESLNREVRDTNIKAAKEARQVALQDSAGKTGIWKSVKYAVKSFFEPLRTLGPVPRPRGRGRDWSLTLIAVAGFFYNLTIGMYPIKYLYAKHAFEWDGEHLSYYITAAGTCRMIYLMLILPTIITFFKPADASPAPIATASEPTNNTTTDPTQKKTSTPKMISAEIKFDLQVARGSLAIDVISNILVVIANMEPLFIVFSLLSAGGAALIPAIQSIAMCTLHLRQRLKDEDAAVFTKGGTDFGKLFGAFALLQATGSMIIGPMLFGGVYSITVSTYPKTIFLIAASLQLTGFLLLCLVRRPRVDVPIEIRVERQVRVHIERQRGRSRASKDISSAL
ncbi:hypothetical protein M422DRAFT_44287 [Sphaerobolus stellatus SS14]|nr:hypothetical protein M422DRAFT_44287 [Sphaerobolus stellatus SS14]